MTSTTLTTVGIIANIKVLMWQLNLKSTTVSRVTGGRFHQLPEFVYITGS